MFSLTLIQRHSNIVDLQVRFLIHQNTALFSTFRLSVHSSSFPFPLLLLLLLWTVDALVTRLTLHTRVKPVTVSHPVQPSIAQYSPVQFSTAM